MLNASAPSPPIDVWENASLAWQNRREFTTATANNNNNNDEDDDDALVLRFDAAGLSVETFRRECQDCNRPCLISNVDLGGSATTDWVNNETDGSPNWAAMGALFGEALVPVTMTSEEKKDCEDSDTSSSVNTTTTMQFQSFIGLLLNKRQGAEECGDKPMQGTTSEVGTTSEHSNALTGDKNALVPYCKDWHLCHEYPDYKVYETPQWFRDDWLNEWWDTRNRQRSTASASRPTGVGVNPSPANRVGSDDEGQGKEAPGSDYRFLYAGGRGSFTPLHHDVFKSNSWSINICGRKLWALFPPSAAAMLKDDRGNVMPNAFSPDLNLRKFPHARDPAVQHMEILVQHPGTAIFVPSGWYHQVLNLCDTISVNHNWFNRHNIMQVTCYLLDELQLCRETIEDCRAEHLDRSSGSVDQRGGQLRSSMCADLLTSDLTSGGRQNASSKSEVVCREVDLPWEGLCQSLLRANCGMNIPELYQLLTAKANVGPSQRVDGVTDNDQVDINADADRLAAQAAIGRIMNDPALAQLLHPSSPRMKVKVGW